MRSVLHVVESFSTGIFTFLKHVTDALASEYHFAILHGIRAETPPHPAAYFEPQVKLIRWEVGRAVALQADLRAYSQLTRVIDIIKPDLIHAHSSKAGALGRIAAWRLGIPIVYTPQAYAFLDPNMSSLQKWLYWLAEYALGYLPHVTAGCGDAEYRIALRFARHAMAIPNAVPRVSPTFPLATSTEPLTVVMLGSIRPQKNFPAFCRIASRPELAPVRFLWIGGGTVPSGLALPRNLQVTGLLPHEVAIQLLRKADIFLQTSLWDGLSLSVLEALTLGKPVVATATPANIDLIADGYSGFLCGDESEMAIKIVELANNRHRLAEMGINARRTVEEKFNFDETIRRLRTLYDKSELLSN